MKKMIPILLAICLLLAAFSGITAMAAAPVTGDGWSFDPDSGTLTVTTNAGASYAWKNDPNFSDTYTVDDVIHIIVEEGVTTTTSSFAFADLPNLTSIKLPSTLEVIGPGMLIRAC
jgi:hypothetical protein